MTTILEITVGLMPVLVFLFGLVFLDSYKLIKPSSLLIAVAMGGLLALLCLVINDHIIGLSGLSLSQYSRYLAPAIEEICKALYLAHLLLSRRIGFLVDATIFGFAIGAGFATLENIYFFSQLKNTNLLIWVVRGMGTAVMHGGTTATLAILAKNLLDRNEERSWKIFIPGLLVTIAVHSFYNHFVLPPLTSTLAVLLVLSLLLLFVFSASERSTRAWLHLGLDSEVEMLEIINEGKLTQANVGKYLSNLKSSLPGEVVGDMVCFLRVYLELAIRAKGILLLHEAGVNIPEDMEIKEKLTELKYLEKSIGKTGRLAIQPMLRMNDRDLWQLHMLGRNKIS